MKKILVLQNGVQRDERFASVVQKVFPECDIRIMKTERAEENDRCPNRVCFGTSTAAPLQKDRKGTPV